jgi:hypothetical protein
MPRRSLIVLQENSGRVPLPDGLPAVTRDAIFAVIDKLAETFENVKTSLQASGHYSVVHLLTDNLCTRSQLLDKLMTGFKESLEFDLIVLGHGNENELVMNTAPNLTVGPNGNIRSLLTEARAHGVNGLCLRMVYMCNCYGSRFNDDWRAIGARVAIGSEKNDYMPEPMTTFFIQNWLKGRTASDAAKDAYERTVPLYKPVFPDRPQTRYKTIPVPDPRHPGKMVDQQVPDGVDMITDQKILDTRLIVGGAGGGTF